MHPFFAIRFPCRIPSSKLSVFPCLPPSRLSVAAPLLWWATVLRRLLLIWARVLSTQVCCLIRGTRCLKFSPWFVRLIYSMWKKRLIGVQRAHFYEIYAEQKISTGCDYAPQLSNPNNAYIPWIKYILSARLYLLFYCLLCYACGGTRNFQLLLFAVYLKITLALWNWLRINSQSEEEQGMTAWQFTEDKWHCFSPLLALWLYNVEGIAWEFDWKETIFYRVSDKH